MSDIKLILWFSFSANKDDLHVYNVLAQSRWLRSHLILPRKAAKRKLALVIESLKIITPKN